MFSNVDPFFIFVFRRKKKEETENDTMVKINTKNTNIKIENLPKKLKNTM